MLALAWLADGLAGLCAYRPLVTSQWWERTWGLAGPVEGGALDLITIGITLLVGLLLGVIFVLLLPPASVPVPAPPPTGDPAISVTAPRRDCSNSC